MTFYCTILILLTCKLNKERVKIKEYFSKIYKKTKSEFYAIVEENIIDENKMFIVTANPETIMVAQENKNLEEALLDKNTTIIPDGIGIIKGAKILGFQMEQTIPGVELCTKLFEYCNKYKKSIFLFGSKQEVVLKLANKIEQDYPNLYICGYENGYVEDKQSCFDNISKLNPDVVLVALGIPHQELLIYNNLNKFNKGIFIGVGGSFDVLSGTKKRAPKIFIKLHLEWLYRILKEPKRIKRFFNNNIKYILQVRRIKNFERKSN